MYTHEYKWVQHGVPLHEAECVFVMVHGRGGTAEGILPLSQQFMDENIHTIALQANNRSWYPYSFLAPRVENQPSLDSALNNLDKLISDLIEQNISTQKIVLVGFSQGACLVLDYLARFAAKQSLQFRAVIAFTGGLIGSRLEQGDYQGDLKQTPVWISGGDQDFHVPLERMQESKEILDLLGAKVQLEIYPDKPHSISPDEINAVNVWLLSFVDTDFTGSNKA